MKHIPDFILYLTGFFSTVLFVFCGISHSSNKTLFIWTLFGGIVFGLLTGFLIWQNEVWKNKADTTIARQNAIVPDISCSMEYPIKVEKDRSFRDTKNPAIIIKNSGPIAAVSLSAVINIYVYNTKENEIVEFIINQHGKPQTYANTFAPTANVLTKDLILFTGEKIKSTAGKCHMIGEKYQVFS